MKARILFALLALAVIGCGAAYFLDGLHTQPYMCGGFFKNAESIPHMVNATTKDILCWHSGTNDVNVCDSHLASDNITVIRNCSLESWLYIEFYTQNSTIANWFDGRKAHSPTGMEVVGPMITDGKEKQLWGVAIMVIGVLAFLSCCFKDDFFEDDKTANEGNNYES